VHGRPGEEATLAPAPRQGSAKDLTKKNFGGDEDHSRYTSCLVSDYKILFFRIIKRLVLSRAMALSGNHSSPTFGVGGGDSPVHTTAFPLTSNGETPVTPVFRPMASTRSCPAAIQALNATNGSPNKCQFAMSMKLQEEGITAPIAAAPTQCDPVESPAVRNESPQVEMSEPIAAVPIAAVPIAAVPIAAVPIAAGLVAVTEITVEPRLIPPAGRGALMGLRSRTR
jgi:hypothetical protein